MFRPTISVLLLVACCMVFPVAQAWSLVKSLPEIPPPSPGYLSFHSPPKLRFHVLKPLGDRKNLLRLTDRQGASAGTSDASESEQMPVSTEFPLVTYNDDLNVSKTYNIPTGQFSNDGIPPTQNLPPVDPFVEPVVPSGNLNDTDELIDILESGSSGRGNLAPSVEFIPPYTLDGGNLILGSKSKYIKRAK